MLRRNRVALSLSAALLVTVLAVPGVAAGEPSSLPRNPTEERVSLTAFEDTGEFELELEAPESSDSPENNTDPSDPAGSSVPDDEWAATDEQPADVVTSAPSLQDVENEAVSEVIPFPAGITRLEGRSRYDTAIAVSQRFTPGVDALFIATGQNFPDALSAAAAAATKGGPLLLTTTASLPPAVHKEILRLKPKEIFIAGGLGAVSKSVEQVLSSVAPVQRLDGFSRYETGNSIVRNTFESAPRAFIATGRTFPDALAATGAAGSIGAPVILVDGTLRRLSSDTTTLLRDLGVQEVTIVGGTGAVSAGIETQLSQTYTTQRIGGSSRYATAANINEEFFIPGSVDTAFLATGQNFPDALAGAALAGQLGSPVYIAMTSCVPEEAHESLVRLGALGTVVLGGASVVNSNAARNVGCLTAGKPTISGTKQVGARLTAAPGAWTAGTSFAYQWRVNGAAIRGATGSTLVLTENHAGKQISVSVTGSMPSYLSRTNTSASTGKIGYPGRTKPSPSGTCPAWAQIKGNHSSSGERIYHVPGGQFYNRTTPEECFRTEADARAAGYRRSLK